MKEQQHREEEIFIQALEIEVGPAREAYLDEACGGEENLREKVGKLVEAHEEPATILGALGGMGAPAGERAGDQIGSYELLEELGAGGMGTVWLAQQSEPVVRKVALKIIKLGMDTEEVIARFGGERQALAVMDHSGIAKVFDAGVSPGGRPFFVMELVEGCPITEYCFENRLSIIDRIRLFIRVCSAVEHAHQKGIIHRDLSPSNILVSTDPETGGPMPKIIDFGIAKAMEDNTAGTALVTRADQILGTPLFMSPEQAGLCRSQVDTRSDVYALGIVLYGLLAGTAPFDRKALDKATLDEVRRIIHETEPERPSTAARNLSPEKLADVASARLSSPERVLSHLEGELDWIVMKCIEKEKERRYPSVSGLSQDLERFLANEPIQAAPPSVSYLARKFVLRHRIACAFVVSLFVALGAGALFTTWQWRHARAAEQHARSAEQHARAAERQARAAEQQEIAKRQQVEELFSHLGGISTTLHKELARVGREHAIEPLQQVMQDYLNLVPDAEKTDGAILFASEMLSRSGKLQFHTERVAEARINWSRCLELRKELVRRDPNNAEYVDALEGALRNIGWLHRRTGEFDLALESYNLLEKLNRDRIERTVKVPSEKEPARNDLAATLTIKATILLGAGRVDEAHKACEEGTKIRSQLAASRPDSHIFREDLAYTLLRLADIAAARGSFGRAREHLDKAVELRAARAATDTTDLARQHVLAVAQCRRGKFLRDRNHYAEAMIDVRQAIQSWERLLREDEVSAKWIHAHAEGVLLQLDLAALGQDEEFLAKCESALVSIANMPGLEAPLVKAQAHAGLAKCYAKQGNDAGARKQQGLAQSLIDEVLSAQPNRVTAHTINRWCQEQEWTPIKWLFRDF